MLVKSFGCSFIYGTDLSDCTQTQFSRLTWPAVVCQQLNHYYRCYARAGIGNLAIAELALTHIAADPTALYVIGWTWIDRFDYIDAQSTHPEWSTIRPVDRDQLSKIYYQHLHSELRDKFQSLMAIRTTIDSLKQKDLPFVMTYMDELMFDQTHNTTPAICALQQYIQPYMTRFEGKTFLDWSRAKGYPESAMLHPLEQAHCAAADLIRPIFRS
jgi:hypothetical protein